MHSAQVREVDVVVVGGGPAGIGAAVAAARNGVRTLLVEGTNQLGGMGTSGLVPIQQGTAHDIHGGIVEELWSRAAAQGAVWAGHGGSSFVNPCVLAVVAQRMVLESGAGLLYHAMGDGVQMGPDRIEGVFVASKGGRELVQAGVIVDATGDADIAAWADVPFDKGADSDGRLQAVSLNFLVAGVDESRVADRRTVLDRIDAAIADGTLQFADNESLWLGLPLGIYPPGMRFFQLDMASGIDSSDADSLSRGEAVCRERVFRAWRFLQQNVAGFEASTLVHVASYLGVRESRRVRGEYTLCAQDILQARKFADGICRNDFYMDLHDGQFKGGDHQVTRTPPPGDYYEIPYRCLLPLQVDGLLVAGRCLSATREAHGSARTQGTCMNMGQAAGTAAAVCVQRGVTPRQLRGQELRSILVSQGMRL